MFLFGSLFHLGCDLGYLECTDLSSVSTKLLCTHYLLNASPFPTTLKCHIYDGLGLYTYLELFH